MGSVYQVLDSWLPTIEGSHSNHNNIKVLVEAFESQLYSPQSIFDTLRSHCCQLLCYVGTFRSHPLLQQHRVCRTAALPFRLKSILRQKQPGLWKLKYFTMQKYNLQKTLWKKPKSFKRLWLYLKFQHKAKYHLSRFLFSRTGPELDPRFHSFCGTTSILNLF